MNKFSRLCDNKNLLNFRGDLDSDPKKYYPFSVIATLLHRVRKKGTNSILGITSSNTDRFSNFFSPLQSPGNLQ